MSPLEPSPGLEGLLATWQAWNRRDVLARAAGRAANAGDTERAAALHALLDGQEAPSRTAALAAQHELASLLKGWRWQTVAAARAEGATWDDVAAATGTTAEAARADHARQLTRAEAAALAAGLEFDHDRYRLDADEPQHELGHDEPAAPVQEASMSETADHDTGAAAAHPAWPTPDPTLPPAQLTDRELIARAAYCDEIAHTGSAADQAAALRDLDAAWDEAERRAAGQPAISVPAQVAGYIGLVREDYDHALAAEAATWRQQLDGALPSSEPALGLAADRVPSTAARGAGGELTVGERADRAQSLAQAAGLDVAGYDPDTDVYTDPDTGQVVRLDGRAGAKDLGAVDGEASSAIAERDGFVLVDPAAPGGVRALSADERATLAEQVRAARPTQPARWSADEHEAYLDSRPDETSPFNPAADYGDPDWREPASDAEAAARTSWLAENVPPASGWSPPTNTEVDDALDAARERAVHSDWAHDHDPHAWAQYRRLEALAGLAPLPERDALDDLADDEPDFDALATVEDWHGEDRVAGDRLADQAALDVPATGDSADDPFTDPRGRWWPSTGAWAAGTCDPARDHDDGQLEAPDDPQRLRQRIEDLRSAIAAREASAEGEERREQLQRWHDDDHRVTDAPTETQQDTQDGLGDGEPGWTR
ncbi:hypothetical protein [Actinomycetospora lemnae]|uniref:Uncharacterized protein n=1 Tax=Actinomycetospora lemnae TaxID=3019891 RepID=A0ABT5SY62_9PSEU|nr:hypothetical protein [Actinomycetospora sp. DW7H6]MDD7967793.1 hypothetical protein [Actinomycetospora sp. DW7H6]